ncbi:MAG: hypothetical protein A3G32_01945 [Deltaproteobacteria bacterium RIFCSPLOWO2_12_FULL_40_28]|nr:MAG: hypothetical protein A3C45_06690 [Deltaproteobacteria bacterium RIFCSPHIGHO2_02_FULL_40_28]OGQ18892.1 MAG: hypothetical protein A3E27_09325 [Deltaproteobacteria bacterium RIFCSPHIGHO2_12_FULL_40_32]OGQ40137.1 MAG: hypothetical protein A3I69_01855 [Deltaproteobacteria bacterium RIFCSPLOWO2_02_FULL_40_36]OGQ53320.1 MAG: hypothetical protein A3G32_01945 [Deltaproteobacteria bacterium RIFCSPLOWO2_12_FULL_40_28]
MAIEISVLTHLIEKALPGAKIMVKDLVGDGDHLQATVIATQFEGKTLLEQHKMVLNPLKENLKERLHALSVKTYTLDQWNKNK